jgi:hypothetical protein
MPLTNNRVPESAKQRVSVSRHGSLGEQVLSHAQAGREVVQDFVPLVPFSADKFRATSPWDREISAQLRERARNRIPPRGLFVTDPRGGVP